MLELCVELLTQHMLHSVICHTALLVARAHNTIPDLDEFCLFSMTYLLTS